jgi:hypothetical protein
MKMQYGQLGLGSVTTYATPQMVTYFLNETIVEIVAGQYSSYARTGLLSIVFCYFLIAFNSYKQLVCLGNRLFTWD